MRSGCRPAPRITPTDLPITWPEHSLRTLWGISQNSSLFSVIVTLLLTHCSLSSVIHIADGTSLEHMAPGYKTGQKQCWGVRQSPWAPYRGARNGIWAGSVLSSTTFRAHNSPSALGPEGGRAHSGSSLMPFSHQASRVPPSPLPKPSDLMAILRAG